MKPVMCSSIEGDLAAVAAGEADAATIRRVDAHLKGCPACRTLIESYRQVEAGTAALRDRAPDAEGQARAARERLQQGLADLRKRIVRYAIFPSPLGDVLVGRTEIGVAFVHYLSGRRERPTEVFENQGLDAVEDLRGLDAIGKELDVYFERGSRRLEWPIDLCFVRSPFQRAVLEATAGVPYGAVVSYKKIAQEIGRPEAVRAVAQALRHNPVAIAIPCHRIVGSTGDLTGYAGDKISLKEKLLSLEGVPVRHADLRIERSAMYLLGPGDSEYCVPSCPSVLALPQGGLMLFGSRESAESAGWRPCSTCRPDLHPLEPTEGS